MRGFFRARFQGESAVVASLDYRWPIWSFLDANLFFDHGNTFAAHLDDFSMKRLHSGYGLALRTNTSRDVSFQILLAIGSEANSLEPSEYITMAGTNVGF
jgi:outer membrane protein assembly factor BamA